MHSSVSVPDGRASHVPPAAAHASSQFSPELPGAERRQRSPVLPHLASGSASGGWLGRSGLGGWIGGELGGGDGGDGGRLGDGGGAVGGGGAGDGGNAGGCGGDGEMPAHGQKRRQSE